MIVVPKVFGIGLSRTGTTSLCKALRILGYNSIHMPRDIVEIAECDAATDITVSMRFKQLDAIYPDARWIYTIRDVDSWLTSCRRHFGNVDDPPHWSMGDISADNAIDAAYREAAFTIYGQIQFDRSAWRSAYEKHDRRVRSYFRDRPLLVMDIENTEPKDLWVSLIHFLEIPFPHLNESR